jgi:hypothetical protein
MKTITNAQAKQLVSAYKVLSQVIDRTNPRQANAIRKINQIIKRL